MDTLANPVTAILVIGVLLALIAALAAWRVKGTGKRAALVTVSALCLLLSSWLAVAAYASHWINSRHRAYRAFYQHIEVGMSREQVLANMEALYPSEDPRKRPRLIVDEPGELGFLMTPEAPSDPNAEGISVELVDGRVSRKFYSRD